MESAVFVLHERLAADCFWLGDFPASRLLLMNNTHFPWYILVPRFVGARELYLLPETDQLQVLQESSLLSRVIMGVHFGQKLNLAALGNMVPQLHIHHIVRYQTDVAWPGPVWGQVAAEPYPQATVEGVQQSLLAAMRAESVEFQANQLS